MKHIETYKGTDSAFSEFGLQERFKERCECILIFGVCVCMSVYILTNTIEAKKEAKNFSNNGILTEMIKLFCVFEQIHDEGSVYEFVGWTRNKPPMSGMHTSDLLRFNMES